MSSRPIEHPRPTILEDLDERDVHLRNQRGRDSSALAGSCSTVFREMEYFLRYVAQSCLETYEYLDKLESALENRSRDLNANWRDLITGSTSIVSAPSPNDALVYSQDED